MKDSVSVDDYKDTVIEAGFKQKEMRLRGNPFKHKKTGKFLSETHYKFQKVSEEIQIKDDK